MKKFKVVTLGCRTNQYESQAYTDQLRELGYIPIENGQEADLCIVNTCTVTQGADSSSRHEIRSLLRMHPRAKIAVTGCMAETARDALHQLDPRIQVVPNAQKEQLLEILFPEEEHLPEFQIKRFDAHTRAFVKVQDGCNSFCSYCIIPYVRGRSRSRPIPEVIREVEGLIAQGYKEVVLTGINIGDFDGGGRLADLVRAIDRLPGLHRLRVSSIDPDEVDEDLTNAILDGKTTCPSMHIVLQSGSNVILKKMNRKYTKQIFLETVERLLKKEPSFTITTDIIVGFPGESESDFMETLQVIEQTPCAHVHAFRFSARKRTRAALYPNQIAVDVVQQRQQKALRAGAHRTFAVQNDFLGRRMSVLLENNAEESGFLSGHTPNFLRVYVDSSKGRPNELVEVELIENRPEGLIGRIA